LASQGEAAPAPAARASGVNSGNDLDWAVAASVALLAIYVAIRFNGILNESE